MSSDVVDKLHDKDRLTDTSATKETNLSTFCIRFNQVDDLDTGEKHLLFC